MHLTVKSCQRPLQHRNPDRSDLRLPAVTVCMLDDEKAPGLYPSGKDLDGKSQDLCKKKKNYNHNQIN